MSGKALRFNVSCIVLAVLLITASAHAFSQQDLVNRSQEIHNILTQSSTAYLAVGVAILLSALMYMGASLFSNPKLLAMSKDTFYQAIVSLVIIASLPILYVVISQIVIEVFFNGMQINGSIFDISKMFLVWNYIFFSIHLVLLTIINLTINSLINQTYSIPVGGPLVTINLTYAAKPLMYIVSTMVSVMTTSFMINGFQLLFLNLVEYSILPIFLPLGVILRAFPSSMNAGNILIALSIGSYIITPAIYAFDIYLLTNIADNYPSGTGLLPSFYSTNTIKMVLGARNCPFLNKLYEGYLDRDYSIFNGTLETSELEQQCNLDMGLFGKVGNIVMDLPPWAKIAVGAKMVSMLSGLSMKISRNARFQRVMQWISSISSIVLGISIFIYLVDIIEETAISFIILSAIIPFLNFTIIILFIRDISLNVFGTPVSLGHLVRLI